PSPTQTSEVPLVPQTDPSPTHTIKVPVELQTDPSPRPSPSTTSPDSIPESSGGNLGGHSSSDKSLSGNEDWQERDPQRNNGCTKDVLSTDKEKVSTDKEKVSTDRPIVSTDGSKVSTDKQIEGIDEQIEGTDRQIEGTDEQIKGTDEQRKDSDDHTEEGTKAVSREKEKGVELKDIEETDRPRPTSTRSLLTLKPLPKIDPKDKGKKKIEEEDESKSESDGIPEAKKKFKQLARDEEMARKVQEEWEGEEERKRLDEEEATNEALIINYDDIKARIKADRLLAEKLQEEEREQFRIEERAKFLHDTI
ncbi:hypothetical protein Tco_0037014, partial [Tanacetum coccineum]